MPHTCAKCSRVNPQDAAYCYYDGVALNGHANGGGPVSIGRQAFSSPFTLPSGKVCQNFDQLALGCQDDLKAAFDVLKQGYLEKFLAGQGRADLAMAAKQAAKSPDLRGLDDFLAKLPTQALQEPKLLVEPTEFNLGILKFGEDRKIELKLQNQGMRLVYGSVTVENGLWLSIGNASGVQQKLFQFGNEQAIAIHIQGKKLRASNKPLEAKLLIESNAGNMIVIVKAEVPVKAYPAGSCLAGARSPRQIAEKAKASARDAAEQFERGKVAEWYKENGWTYPVRGPAASGLGAVQQFFEALGLTPPPKVDVGDKQIGFQSDPGGQCRYMLEVRSQEKRPVYAHGTSDQPWLEVGKPRLNGRVATIPLTVPNVPNRPGEVLKAKLVVTGNGNQRFVIPVTLTIGGAGNAFTPLLPTGDAGGALVGDSPFVGKFKKGRTVAIWPLLLLFLALCGVMAWDLFRRPGGPDSVDPGDPLANVDDKGVKFEPITPYDTENRIAVSFAEDTQRFGISLTKFKDPKYKEKFKQLTSHERGLNNNTVVNIEEFPYVFGREIPGVRYVREGGKLVKEKKIGDRAWMTSMYFEGQKIMVSQIVEIVVGEQTRLYDTLLIKYRIRNYDSKLHTVGLRVMLDTYIGANDGVPIEIGPSPKVPVYAGNPLAGMDVFEKEKIPDYIRAIEDPNDIAGKQTTVAEMGLKLRNFEPIQKLVVCRWPQEQGGSEARWDWKYEPMNARATEADSCVVLYWSKLNMAANEVRTCGFTYGLGRIASDPGDQEVKSVFTSKMRLDARPAKMDRPFVITATTKGANGQTVTLDLPPELTLVSGSPGQVIKEEAGKPGTTSWVVKGKKVGTFKVKTTLGDGTVAESGVIIRKDTIFSQD